MLSTLLEKGGCSDRDKLDRRWSVRLIIHLKLTALTLGHCILSQRSSNSVRLSTARFLPRERATGLCPYVTSRRSIETAEGIELVFRGNTNNLRNCNGPTDCNELQRAWKWLNYRIYRSLLSRITRLSSQSPEFRSTSVKMMQLKSWAAPPRDQGGHYSPLSDAGGGHNLGIIFISNIQQQCNICLLYTSPSPRD